MKIHLLGFAIFAGAFAVGYPGSNAATDITIYNSTIITGTSKPVPSPAVSAGKTSSYHAEVDKFPTIFGRSLAPSGYADFCRNTPEECNVGVAPKNVSTSPVVILTNNALEDLNTVNSHVNRSIHPASDMELHFVEEQWSYPVNGFGDCEDYVLEKRRMLVQAGWDENVLLISVAYDEDGLGHAVLHVRTDHGDLVLDNRRDDIRRWNDTGYEYVAQQSQQHPLLWVSLRQKQGQPTSTSKTLNLN